MEKANQPWGDPRQWEKVVNSGSERMKAAIRRRFGKLLTREEIEDIVAEAILELCERFATSKYDASRSSLTTFFNLICRSRVIDCARKKQRRPMFVLFDEQTLVAAARGAGERSEESVREADELLEMFWEAWRGLTEEERKLLSDWSEGVKLKEIAAARGLSTDTTGMKLYRAKKKLRSIAQTTLGQKEGDK